MSKQRLEDLIVELDKTFKEVELLAEYHKSVTIKDASGFSESFSAIVGSFRPRLDNHIKKLEQISNKLPSERRKRRKDV